MIGAVSNYFCDDNNDYAPLDDLNEALFKEVILQNLPFEPEIPVECNTAQKKWTYYKKKEWDRVLKKVQFVGEFASVTPFLHFRYLESLNLSGNLITSVDARIYKLNHLNLLHLYGNGLTELPSSISQLTNLTDLNVGSNPFDRFPHEILPLTRLKSLRIDNCQITDLTEQIICFSELESLDCDNNKITLIPDCIVKLTKLAKLSFQACGLVALPENLLQLPKLEVLNLSYNCLDVMPGLLTAGSFLEIRCNYFNEDKKNPNPHFSKLL